MAAFMIIGVVSVENSNKEKEKHLAILATCEKRQEFLDALKEVSKNKDSNIEEILCVQGSVLPMKMEGNTIKAIEISKLEYSLGEEKQSTYVSTPVYIKGGNNA